MRRKVRALIVAVLVAATVVAGSANLWVDEQRGLLDHVNYFRQVSGMPPLKVHWDLSDDAQRHAERMAVQQELFHMPLPELRAVTTSGWTRIGENIGTATTIEGVMQGWFASSPHRANLLGDYRWIGIGNYRAGGQVWVSIVLMR